ncbi:hypothetical protein BASA81_004736 [Batrachochytrium salamandrivorans]|nr:hypothetical protein BASA81_004736 [Batrachochytrium salamandrivorans]
MSIRIFREHLDVLSDGSVNASRINSRECYEAFLHVKKSTDCEKEAKKFRRTLTTHLTGVDGRRAFDIKEEEAILLVLRENKPWPCFSQHSQVCITFRGKGFHEKQRASNKLKADGGGDSGSDDGEAIEPKLDMTDPDNTRFFLNLATYAVGVATTFVGMGVDCWRSLLGLFKFVLLARTTAVSKHTTEAYTKQLCERTSARFGGTRCVTVMDLTRKEFDKRVCAQNARSVAEYGNMVGNLDGMWMRYPDLFHVAIALGACYSAPGEVRTTRQTYLVRGNLVQHNVTYTVDPDSFLVVVVGWE